MRLKLHNAMTLGFANTIAESDRKGAIPFFFQIDPAEAYQLLRELNRCKEVREHYKFEQEDGKHDTKLRLFGEMPDTDELNDIANEWFKRTIGISYKNYPIYIVNTPEPKKPRDRRFVREMKKKR